MAAFFVTDSFVYFRRLYYFFSSMSMNKSDRTLNIQYSFLHFGYWVDYLIISSFAAVLLSGRGFSASEIGYVTTIGAVLTIILQTTLSDLADRSEKITVRQIITALLTGGAAVALIMWLIPSSYAVSFICMFTALSLMNTLSPLTVSLCLQYNAAGHNINFGVARSIGSLGYALAGFVMGRITESLGTEILLPVFSVMQVGLLILVNLMKKPAKDNVALSRNRNVADEEAPSSLLSFFRKYRQYDVFLLSVMCVYFMQMMTNTYMIFFVEHYGGGQADMGTVLSVAAFAEMPAVFLGMALMKRFSASTLLRTCAIGGFTKFTLMLFIPNTAWLIGIQLIQFFFSGLYMVSSVYFANSIVGRRDSVKAQSIMAVAVTGVTGIAANTGGGWMLEHLPIRTILMIGTAISLVGVILMFIATGKAWGSLKNTESGESYDPSI